MATVTAVSDQGSVWGARADDWAGVQEWLSRPAYDAILDRLAPWQQIRLLDLGCGAGGFASLAAARGALVAGVDAAPELVDVAERRTTGAFRVGDLAHLPYADHSFAVVTGINSFQYAADPAAALAEAARVVRPGGALVAAVWSPSQECEAAAYVAALGCGTAGPFTLSARGVLEDLVAATGLVPGGPATIDCPWRYRDEETALRGLMSGGHAVRAARRDGAAAVAAAVLDAIRPYRHTDGSYLLHNSIRYVVARR